MQRHEKKKSLFFFFKEEWLEIMNMTSTVTKLRHIYIYTPTTGVVCSVL